jgi:hypothetical protein
MTTARYGPVISILAPYLRKALHQEPILLSAVGDTKEEILLSQYIPSKASPPRPRPRTSANVRRLKLLISPQMKVHVLRTWGGVWSKQRQGRAIPTQRVRGNSRLRVCGDRLSRTCKVMTGQRTSSWTYHIKSFFNTFKGNISKLIAASVCSACDLFGASRYLSFHASHTLSYFILGMLPCFVAEQGSICRPRIDSIMFEVCHRVRLKPGVRRHSPVPNASPPHHRSQSRALKTL